jgi:hypothetical protein
MVRSPRKRASRTMWPVPHPSRRAQVRAPPAITAKPLRGDEVVSERAGFSQVTQRPGSSRLATSVSTLTGGSQATAVFRTGGFTTAGAGTLLRASLPFPCVTGRRIRTEVAVSASSRSEIVRVGAAEPAAPSARSALAARLMASEVTAEAWVPPRSRFAARAAPNVRETAIAPIIPLDSCDIALPARGPSPHGDH